MNLLTPIDAFDNFEEVKEFPIDELPEDAFFNLVQATKGLDEREELEPFIRSILADGAQTPHGPAEIVDIFTHRMSVMGDRGMAAFILEGEVVPNC